MTTPTSPLGAEITTWASKYVDTGRLAGVLVHVEQHGEVREIVTVGLRDLDAGTPIEPDTVFRIYSMTKPIVAAAALALLDEGLLGLDDPVSDTVPSFGALTVNLTGEGDTIDAVPVSTPMTVTHLLTHTSGLTYGEGNPGAVARRYETERTDFGPDDGPIAEVVDRLAAIPLVHEPGTRWTYGVSLDVLGRVLEVAAGMPLDEVVATRITGPLGMTDTGFVVPEPARERLAALYGVAPDGGLALLESPQQAPTRERTTTLSGGAGLYSTAGDYTRFCSMLLAGGTLDGRRVLAAESVAAMTTDQLGRDLAACGTATFNETTMAGVGFGFGGSVVLDPARTAWVTSPGEYAWGGYASTAFWISPRDELAVVLMTQLIPSDHYPLRAELREILARHTP